MPENTTEVLEEIAEKLGNSTRELNVEYKRAELGMQALGLGTSAEVPLRTDSPEGLQIGFGKVGKEWVIYFRANPTHEDRQPIANASRGIRVLAVDCLEALLDELVTAARENVLTIKIAVDTAKAFNEHLKTLVGDGD